MPSTQSPNKNTPKKAPNKNSSKRSSPKQSPNKTPNKKNVYLIGTNQHKRKNIWATKNQKYYMTNVEEPLKDVKRINTTNKKVNKMIKNEAASKNSDWDYFWVEGNHEHKFAAPKKYESAIPYEFINNGWVRRNLQNFGILHLKTHRPPNWVNHVGGLDSNILKRINDLSGQHGNFVRVMEVSELWRRHHLMRILLEMAQKVPPNQRESFFKFIFTQL